MSILVNALYGQSVMAPSPKKPFFFSLPKTSPIAFLKGSFWGQKSDYNPHLTLSLDISSNHFDLLARPDPRSLDLLCPDRTKCRLNLHAKLPC
jgi:hypothetical protein